MAKRKLFYLYKRQKQQNSYWYVCYINPETGLQENAKSIDVLKEKLCMGSGSSVKDRDTAAIIAAKALEEGLIFSNAASISFSQYCLDFWDYDNSEYVRMRNKLKKNSIGREYCKNMLSNFKNHVQPITGNRIKLSAVTVELLDRIISTALASGMASGSVQLIILSFSVPLKEAVRRRLIKTNPANFLMKVPRSERKRGILTDEEVARLINYLNTRKGERIPTAVELALVTGMRNGEVRALAKDDISLNYIIRSDGKNLARIVICHSLAPYSGLKTTKNAHSRELYIDNEFAEQLFSVCPQSDFIFTGLKSSNLSSMELRLGFYDILKEIGISESEREERNLTFHSLRHVFNTILYDQNLSVSDRMLVLGHSSEKVNKRYLHESEKQLLEISRVSSSLLSM